MQHSKIYFVDSFGDFSYSVEWNSFGILKNTVFGKKINAIILNLIAIHWKILFYQFADIFSVLLFSKINVLEIFNTSIEITVFHDIKIV